MIKGGKIMKINLTLKEAKTLLSSLYGTQCVANTYPEMPKPVKTDSKEIKPMSDEDVHRSIIQMCMDGKVTIWINYVETYTTDKADYDTIASLLIPYDGEIISIYDLGKAKGRTKWFINTL